jgi:N-acetyl-1-D-myo-inositol-2-amino-2-deoxy-alpha-D-glucopyranoside deacetylase/mycothiol S-conjugate amidase
VITFDPIGGYHHPDHIAIHLATVGAFFLAGKPDEFPGVGAPFTPQKLYYWIPSRGALKVAVGALRLLGRNPGRSGRNRDVDLGSVARVDFPIHARIRVPRHAVQRKHAATLCHRSQVGPALAARRASWLLSHCIGSTEQYMRVHPEPRPATRETDLFEGIV